MELETMFTEQKWNILSCLSQGKYSPLQLAEKLDTTMANISQQLRLLEASNLVKKEKIKNRDKGKPRSLFSLTNDYAYLISTTKGFSGKKLLNVTKHQDIILRIWFLENSNLHYDLEKLYWKIESHISKVASLAVNLKSNVVIIITDNNKDFEKLISKEKELNIKIFSIKDAEKLINLGKEPFSRLNDIFAIYDPNLMLKENEGGEA